MAEAEIYQALAISLGLGLLVGLQREWKESDVAGIRTFPLITLLGTLSTVVNGHQAGWLTAVGGLAVALMLLIANLSKLSARRIEPGITTEMAALLMYVVGAAVGIGQTGPAIVTSGAAAVLLHWKQGLHALVDRIGESDLRAVIQFVLIAMVILPVLPDQTYGPYAVLNPYKIWRMVVLIVGISLVAYVIYKIVGAKAGAVIGGVLGGLISSTATAVSYARQTKENSEVSPMAALVILIASAIVNIRILIEIAAVSKELLHVAWLPLGLMFALMAVESLVLFIPLRNVEAHAPDNDNPAQLKTAILFGVLYAFVLFVLAASREVFGDQALYVVALISGLTDVDAITLSTAKLVNDGLVDPQTAWRVILLATMSNMVFKALAVVSLGSRKLAMYVGVLFGVALLGGAGMLLWWPAAAT